MRIDIESALRELDLPALRQGGRDRMPAPTREDDVGDPGRFVVLDAFDIVELSDEPLAPQKSKRELAIGAWGSA